MPLKLANPPPGTDERMFDPGARRSTIGLKLESKATTSCLVVLPTVTALDMHAGAVTEFLKPLLPEEITVAMPAVLRLSMIALRESESQ